jgi:hypothetical protein
VLAVITLISDLLRMDMNSTRLIFPSLFQCPTLMDATQVSLMTSSTGAAVTWVQIVRSFDCCGVAVDESYSGVMASHIRSCARIDEAKR